MKDSVAWRKAAAEPRDCLFRLPAMLRWPTGASRTGGRTNAWLDRRAGMENPLARSFARDFGGEGCDYRELAGTEGVPPSAAPEQATSLLLPGKLSSRI